MCVLTSIIPLRSTIEKYSMASRSFLSMISAKHNNIYYHALLAIVTGIYISKPQRVIVVVLGLYMHYTLPSDGLVKRIMIFTLWWSHSALQWSSGLDCGDFFWYANDFSIADKDVYSNVMFMKTHNCSLDLQVKITSRMARDLLGYLWGIFL